MPRSRRWSTPIAIFALLLSIMAGPLFGTARAQNQVTLRVWDQFTDEPANTVVQNIYNDFMAKDPNIKIEREAVSSDQMRQTVNTAIASGTGPDVILYDAGPGYAGLLANAGLLLPLDQYAAKYGWSEKIAAPAKEATTIDGKWYGLPLSVDLIGMYYNKTLLDKEGLAVPKTFDDLVAFCGQARAKGYTPIAFADNPGWQAFHQFSMTSNQMIGPDAMRKLLYDHQGSWDTPPIVTAIKSYFVDLNKANCFPPDPAAITYDDGNSLFFTGQALLHTTGSWLIRDMEEQMTDYEVGFVPFPAIAGGKGSVWISGVGAAYYITAKTAHPDEAASFLDYLFSQATLAKWTGDAKIFVPVKFDVSNLQISPLAKSVIDVLQSANEPNGPKFGYNVDVLAPPQFNDMMQNGFQAILAGQKTPEQEAADLEAAWKQGMSGAATPQT
jgi:raffinose/stachyose/melibiose transport system substrate-binding protein